MHELRAPAADFIVDTSRGSVVTVHVPLTRPGVVTHWSLTFFDAHNSPKASRPVRCDVLLGDCVAAADLAIPWTCNGASRAGAGDVTMVFPVFEYPWDLLYGSREGASISAKSTVQRLEAWSKRRIEDARVTFVFHAGATTAKRMQLGSINVFGVVTSPLHAQEELWRLQMNHHLHQYRDLVPFVLGAHAPVAAEAPLESLSPAQDDDVQRALAPLDAEEAFLREVALTDVDSLLSLLMLEAKRVSLGLSQSQRNTCLYRAGRRVCAYDPRKLLFHRDAYVEQLIRQSIPSSFLECAMGPSCRGKALTLSVSRNQPCFQCRKRFCNRCMEETFLLEATDGVAPVCFACSGEIEQERGLLVQLQRHKKLELATADSAADIGKRLVPSHTHKLV